MMLRSRKKITREVSLYEPIGTDKEGNEIHLFDLVEGNDTDVSEICVLKDDVRQLHQWIDEVLTPLEREVIEYRYGLSGKPEQTQRVIAKRLQISRSYVSRIEKNAISKLRSRFLSA